MPLLQLQDPLYRVREGELSNCYIHKCNLLYTKKYTVLHSLQGSPSPLQELEEGDCRPQTSSIAIHEGK